MWDDDVIDFLLEEENAANYTPEHFHNEVKLNKNLCQIFIQTIKMLLALVAKCFIFSKSN